MVIKMDKSDEFIKSGKKLISEYEGANLKEDEEQKPELLNEEVLLSWRYHIDSYVFKLKQSMHNLISCNSLRPWMNVEPETSPNDAVDDYFECISECDVRDKSCISHCRVLLD